VPLLSFAVAIVRDLPVARVLIPFWERPVIRYGVPLLTGGVIARDAARVPFIVRAPRQRDRADVRVPERAEQLLVRTVRDACSPPL